LLSTDSWSSSGATTPSQHWSVWPKQPTEAAAASITVYPIVPDYEHYPEFKRDADYTFGEIGLAGQWIEVLLHHMFLYKARLRAGLVPDSGVIMSEPLTPGLCAQPTLRALVALG
jgi:hypothetical protein